MVKTSLVEIKQSDFLSFAENYYNTVCQCYSLPETRISSNPINQEGLYLSLSEVFGSQTSREYSCLSVLIWSLFSFMFFWEAIFRITTESFSGYIEIYTVLAVIKPEFKILPTLFARQNFVIFGFEKKIVLSRLRNCVLKQQSLLLLFSDLQSYMSFGMCGWIELGSYATDSVKFETNVEHKRKLERSKQK